MLFVARRLIVAVLDLSFSDVHPDALDDNPVTRYNLVANVCHHGKPHDGFYKAQVLHAVGLRQKKFFRLP